MAKRAVTAPRAASGVRTAFLRAPALGRSLRGVTSRPSAQVEVRERAAQLVVVAAVGPAGRGASVPAGGGGGGGRSGSWSWTGAPAGRAPVTWVRPGAGGRVG